MRAGTGLSVSGDASKATLIGSKFGNAPGDASEMGRSESFMRTPGHTGVVTYRSDVIAFGTAKVSEAATTARRDVRATYSSTRRATCWIPPLAPSRRVPASGGTSTTLS